MEQDYSPTPEKLLQEKCGVIAIYNPTDNIAEQLRLGLTAAGGVQHRGQQGAGVTIHTETGFRTHTGNGLLREAFTPSAIDELTQPGFSHWAIVQTRYGTFGNYDTRNLQPTREVSPEGYQIAVAHNGQFTDIDKMKREFKGQSDGISDTYLFTHKLTHAPGETPDEKFLNTIDQVNGAYCLAAGIDDALYLARDQFGLRPFVLGRLGNGWVAASETFALDKIGVKPEREIKRGEVIRLDKNGLTVLREGQEDQGAACGFERAYFSHPGSLLPTYEGINDPEHVERWLANMTFRKRCGEILAREMLENGFNPQDVDRVTGAPDSGIPFALGLAQALKIPYEPFIIRDHYDPNGDKRLFQGDNNMDGIKGKVPGKLTIVSDPKLYEGLRLLIADDSQVRGNVATMLNEMFLEAGVASVDNAFGFPPVRWPCHLGVSMRTREELIAARHNDDLDAMARETKARNLYYISPEGFVEAARPDNGILIPGKEENIALVNGMCLGCVTGEYPINVDGKINSYLRKEANIH